MRPHNQLVHSRTKVTQRYALMPLEGFPFSRLPGFPDAQVRVLASPALGAGFVQMLIDLPAGKSGKIVADTSIETFFFVTAGEVDFRLDTPGGGGLAAIGAFGLFPPGSTLHFTARTAVQLFIHQKKYQSAPGVPMFKPFFGSDVDVTKTPWADTDKIKLQTLIPDDLQYDMAMNIFTFTPGFGLPIVETHVMEHGLLFLQGKGVYRLGDEWMEVEKDDFIWMGPYCPQSFYATGEQPAKYIYYKDVNRDISL